MAVDVRWPVGADYDCVSDFGVIDHTQPRPEVGEVGHLMLAPVEWVEQLLAMPYHYRADAVGRIHGADEIDGRRFVHLLWGDQRWTWEMHHANFYVLDASGEIKSGQINKFYVGRWPD